jgi:endo-1,4-beta-D-glucanase Y
MSFKCDFSCFNIQPNFDGDRTYSDEQFLLLGQLQIQHKLWINNSQNFNLP